MNDIRWPQITEQLLLLLLYLCWLEISCWFVEQQEKKAQLTCLREQQKLRQRIKIQEVESSSEDEGEKGGSRQSSMSRDNPPHSRTPPEDRESVKGCLVFHIFLDIKCIKTTLAFKIKLEIREKIYMRTIGMKVQLSLKLI